eukprot:s1443_g13.t3
MQKLARDRVKASKPIGSSEEQRLTAELQAALKGGAQAWDENFDKVYDLAWHVVTRNIDTLCPGATLRLPCMQKACQTETAAEQLAFEESRDAAKRLCCCLSNACMVRMRQRGVVPDLTCYNSLLHAFARAALPLQAQASLADLRSQALQPDVITFNTLISAHGGSRESLQFLEEMKFCSVQPTARTYVALASSFERSGQWQAVEVSCIPLWFALCMADPAASLSGSQTAAGRVAHFGF